MFLTISLNLDIQTQYVELLCDFQDSQHKALQYGQFMDVFQLETTIQKILRTIQVKRQELRDELLGESVREFASQYPQYIRDMLQNKLDRLESFENSALDKAGRNTDLALELAGKKPAVPEHWNVFPAADADAGARELVQ